MAWKNVQYENGKMRTSEGGGGGGSSTFADLEDVSFSNLQDGQVPKYNSITQKWENGDESGGSEWHEYSTAEKVVGKWIDGKPLYEKTINAGNNIDVGYDSTVHSEFQHNISNFKEAINLFICCPYLGVSNDSLLTDSNGNIICKFRVDSTKIYASGGLNHYGAYADRYWYFTIQYTKTTD